MAKADVSSTMLSRRSLVTSAAALPALAVPAVAVAACAKPDPIFAAIEALRNTKAEWLEHLEFENDLAAVIPWGRHYCGRDEESTEGCDPRHVTAVRATRARMTDAACTLAGIEPTSIGGVIALLNYYAKLDSKGVESILPDELVDDDDPAVSERWGATYGYFIARMRPAHSSAWRCSDDNLHDRRTCRT